MTTLLLDESSLRARGAIAAGRLRDLTVSLAGDLEMVCARELYFPTEKALLSREGGWCARDGTLLDFDPFNRHEHRCPRCGTVYRGELHERFWIYWYQLWLAERAVHGAVLSVITGDDRFFSCSASILRGYAARYVSYPNADNVLGPSRLFFSTYLESIWLLQICIAADLLAPRDPRLKELVIDRIAEPARQIIAVYDEGASNRQVWNNAALLAAAGVMGDANAADQAVFGTSGIAAHLSTSLLPDGSWYEGENYHLFAHRGLWYGVTMARQAGLELPVALLERFQRGFATPFATALPDFTLPSRRDSQYAISLRQWRIAEHCELGFARVEDSALLGALHRMYESGEPRRDTGRSRSSADVERNAPASGLSRADLSWRALLFARPSLPAGGAATPESAMLPAQGIAVFRRDGGRIYVALDYGISGGGHGHPDRLNLLLVDGGARWLDDFGTGSYVDPSLHWYRSTLAHNAPLVNGCSQLRVDGTLLAYDERHDAGWIMASAPNIAPGVSATRTIVVMPTYVVDIVNWDAGVEVTVDLPLHADLEIESGAGALTAEPLSGGTAIEDGYSFARDTACQRVVADALVVARAVSGVSRLALFANVGVDAEWWRATAPGAPGHGDHVFRVIRARQANGQFSMIWSPRGDVESVKFRNAIVVRLGDGTTHTHRRDGSGWTIGVSAGGIENSIVLGGVVEVSDAELDDRGFVAEPFEETHEVRAINLRRDRATHFELGETHYRRSEQSWREAGEPTASVDLVLRDGTLHVDVAVPHSDRTFAPPDAVNVLDNEHPDINGDGVQLYILAESGVSGWTLVPEVDSANVRTRQLAEWPAPRPMRATWRPTETGYVLHVALPVSEPVFGFDLILNEMPRGRVRRRGQLVLSGAAGEFVYLRGDRHERERLIFLRPTDA